MNKENENQSSDLTLRARSINVAINPKQIEAIRQQGGYEDDTDDEIATQAVHEFLYLRHNSEDEEMCTYDCGVRPYHPVLYRGSLPANAMRGFRVTAHFTREVHDFFNAVARQHKLGVSTLFRLALYDKAYPPSS